MTKKLTNKDFFKQSISEEIWSKKYKASTDKTVYDTFDRVSKKLFPKETKKRNKLKKMMYANKFLPAGRILANAGDDTKPIASLINCLVMEQIPDSMDGIMSIAGEAALSLQRGNGVGYDFSSIRPKGYKVSGVGADTSGPISFMKIFDTMADTIMSAGARRAAQMGVMDIHHPDIIDFITAKRGNGALTKFNLSVNVTNDFMAQLKMYQNTGDDKYKMWQPWFWEKIDMVSWNKVNTLINPALITAGQLPYDINSRGSQYFVFDVDHVEVEYGNCDSGQVFKKVFSNDIDIEELWNIVMASTYDYAEPGVLFLDRVNKLNVLNGVENIRSTNPCVSGDTLVNTSNGFKKVTDLIGRKFTCIVNEHEFDTTNKGFFKTGNKRVVKIETENGNNLTLTLNHKLLQPSVTDDGAWSFEWKMMSEFNEGDSIVLTRYNHSNGVASPTTKITKITDVGMMDVYDVQVPGINAFDGNGIMCHNCGEQPLPPNGACLLGSMNLTQYITHENKFDFVEFMKDVELANETLDNVVEHHGLALEAQENEIITKRRHGLGYTGLGSMFHMLGIDYGSDESVLLTKAITFSLALASFKANVSLAKDKGEFDIDGEPTVEMFGSSEFYSNIMNKDLRGKEYLGSDTKKYIDATHKFIIDNIKTYGLRFSHSTSIAPTGTISLISNNISNGVEPPFSGSYIRNVTDVKDANMKKSERVMDYAFMLAFDESDMGYEEFNEEYSKTHKFAMDVSPSDHIKIQAAAQQFIDSSISKTINIPTNMKFEDFKQVYIEAYDSKLKGLTTFRLNPKMGSAILMTDADLNSLNIQFTLSDGTTQTFKGSDEVEYNGNVLTAYNIYEMLK